MSPEQKFIAMMGLYNALNKDEMRVLDALRFFGLGKVRDVGEVRSL